MAVGLEKASEEKHANKDSCALLGISFAESEVRLASKRNEKEGGGTMQINTRLTLTRLGSVVK